MDWKRAGAGMAREWHSIDAAEGDMKVRSKRSMARIDPVVVTAAGLGAITGVRSMSAPALIAYELADDGAPEPRDAVQRALASPLASRLLAVAAGSEMVADKSSAVPARTSPGPLIGRAVIGSLTAATYAANRRHAVLLPALVGAGAAVASAFAAFHVRTFVTERFNAPDKLIGMIEDAIVVAASRGIAGRMESPRGSTGDSSP